MNDIRSGIVAAARRLGMSPEDLATIISYETGGTFSPTQTGPTTKWGQHKGLIQFGEPQARQYGVDWSNPAGSQLGENGAIVRYFLDRGWRPGMSFMDAYSIVNAGAPGRYNASDTAAGGAPGTVQDKVETQMDDHRKKAVAFLGGKVDAAPFAGTPAEGASNPVAALIGAERKSPIGLLAMLGETPDSTAQTKQQMDAAAADAFARRLAWARANGWRA